MRFNFFKIASAGLFIFSATTPVFAQFTDPGELAGKQVNSITTAVPFLLIAPDSRHGALGDAGAASSPDVFSNHWNASKLAFVAQPYAIGISYTPWLKQLVPDINLLYLSGYYRIDKMQTMGASLRYFSLGEITFTDDGGHITGYGNPNELALDFSYSRKLSERFSIGTAFRFINSDLAQGQRVNDQDIKAGRSVAVDVSGYYQNTDIEINNKKTVLAAGFNVSNIGAKMNYTNSQDRYFIPTNLKVGVSGKMKLDNYNEITLLIDANKLLVPTNPIYDTAGGTTIIVKGEDPNKSVAAGIFGSFDDAPGGTKEELQEISYSTGFEYWYDNQFAFRGGYFYEHPFKGNRQYFTFGAGIRYNVFGLDLAYLIPTQQNNPLQNTLRFSLTFNFEEKKDEVTEPGMN
jgi:hypothetical protein